MIRLDEASQLINIVDQQGLCISRDIIYSLLQACIRKKDIALARKIHSLMISVGLDSVAVLGDHLIRLFAISGAWLEANLVFCQVPKPTVYTWNAIMAAHANLGREEQAMVLYYEMQEEGIQADDVTLLCVLKASSSLGAIKEGALMHHHIVSSAIESSMNVGNSLVNMYAKCGCLEEARKVFDSLPHQDVVSWGAMFSGYAQHGQSLPALKFYEKMEYEGMKPSKVAFLCVLKACGSIEAADQGRLIHDKIIRSGLASDVGVENALVDMYARCKCLNEASKVFEEMPFQDMVSWSALITAFSLQGHGHFALELFDRMQQYGLKPSKVIFSCVLKACACTGSREKARLVHDQLIRSGLELDIVVANALIGAYGKLGTFEEAQSIFDKLLYGDGVSWGSMIAGYGKHGQGFPVLKLFEVMQHEGIEPDKVLLHCLLKACGHTTTLRQGRLVHAKIIWSELVSDALLGDGLVVMYVKCGSFKDAHKVFSDLPCRNAASWSAIMEGYIQEGHGEIALDHFVKMQQEGVKPDKAAFLAVLQGCTRIGSSEWAVFFHDQIARSGLESDKEIGNTLVDLYAKCGNLDKAYEVFNQLPCRGIMSYRAMIARYAQQDQGLCALEIFTRMQEDGVTVDKVSLLGVLKACGSTRTPRFARLLHDFIISSGFGLDVVMGSALVDMYSKLGNLEDAHNVFNSLPEHNVVSWGTLIAGYSQHGYGLLALEFCERMQEEDIKPDEVTITCVLKICGDLGAIKQGRLLNDDVIRRGLDSNVIVGSVLVDMYAKSGSLKEARRVFEKLTCRNMVTWGALIAGYALQGNCMAADRCLSDMERQGLKPDIAIFTNILTAFSHAGLLEEGCQYFNRIKGVRDLAPSTEHYNCMVSLLGRAGCLEEAEDLLCTMPIIPDIIGWKSLLTGCRAHGHVEIGRRCFDQVIEMAPNGASGYMIMSNVYVEAQSWENVEDIQELKRYSGAWKKPGRAWIEVNNRAYEFLVSERGYLPRDNVHEKVWKLSRLLKHGEYVPLLDMMLQSMLCKDNKDVSRGYLCKHLPKLQQQLRAFTHSPPPPTGILGEREVIRNSGEISPVEVRGWGSVPLPSPHLHKF